MLSTHLLADACKSLEKLIELLVIMGLCQACEHLPYDGLILQSVAVWIQDQLSLLVWGQGVHKCHLMTQTKRIYGLLFSLTWKNHPGVQTVQVAKIVLLFSR